jgi:molecular chaperone DnaJ
MNCYDILGVGRNTRPAEIKKAYRRLARKYHPDLNPGDKESEAQFKRISEAYDVLSNPESRRRHDREIDMGIPWTPGTAHGAAGPDVHDFESVYGRAGAGGFASIFSEILGGPGAGAAGRRARRRGDDLARTLRVTFFDALRGLTTEMTLDAESACSACGGSGRVPSTTRRPCPDCAGTGQIGRHAGPLRFSSTCHRCEGEGVLGSAGCGRCGGQGILKRRETVKVRIPPGVDNDSRVRIPGKGRAGRNGGPPGDLYIVTQVEPHPYFRRFGDNIYCTVPITVAEAALGTHIEVPTIDGKTRMRIPPGTENGQKYRLRGKGAPSLRGTARGDHYVEVLVRTPPAVDERARQLLRDLDKLDPGDEIRRQLFG